MVKIHIHNIYLIKKEMWNFTNCYRYQWGEEGSKLYGDFRKQNLRNHSTHNLDEINIFAWFKNPMFERFWKFDWMPDDIWETFNLGHKTFFEVSTLLDVRNCPKLQFCAISKKTNHVNLTKWAQSPTPSTIFFHKFHL